MENSDANVKHKIGITVVLSLDEHQAAELIVIGKADEEVARILGVEIKTIYQWRQKPEFIVALNMLRAASLYSSSAVEETEKTEPITMLIDISRSV